MRRPNQTIRGTGKLSTVPFLKMNGLGNQIIVADMRGRPGRVTPEAAIAINATPGTKFDQIMAIHDSRTPGTASYIEIINSDGTLAQACGNGMRCVVQTLTAEQGRQSFTFETVAGILFGEGQNGLVRKHHAAIETVSYYTSPSPRDCS